jgi:putative ABC transport system permease protein
MTLITLAARNMSRDRARVLLTILAGAVAVVAFVLLRTVLASYYFYADRAATDTLVTRHRISNQIRLPRRYADSVRQVPGVREATYGVLVMGKNGAPPNRGILALAVDAASFLTVYDAISLPADQKARWLSARTGAIAGRRFAVMHGLSVGSTVTLSTRAFDHQLTIEGIYTGDVGQIDEGMLLFHWAYYNDTVPDRERDLVGRIIARVDDGHRGGETANAINSTIGGSGTPTVTMSEKALSLATLAENSAILRAIDIASAVLLTMVALILANTTAMGARERATEYGVLRAIGFTPGQVSALVVYEATLVGLLAGAVGALVAYPVVEVGMRRWLEENSGRLTQFFHVQPLVLLAVPCATAMLGGLAAVLPARRAGALRVVDVLRADH